MTLTPSQLGELRALLEKATPGPWLIRTLENFGFNIVHYVDGNKFNIQRVAKTGQEDDAKLIVALRKNAKPILDALQSLQAERDAIFAEAIEWRDKLTTAQETIQRQREALEEAEFLCDRLDSFEPDYAEAAREYYGHVLPSLERLKQHLSRAALEPSGGER